MLLIMIKNTKKPLSYCIEFNNILLFVRLKYIVKFAQIKIINTFINLTIR